MVNFTQQDFIGDTQMCKYLIELSKCAITKEVPSPANDVKLEKLIKFAQFHQIDNLIYEPLMAANPDNEQTELLKRLQNNVYANAMLDANQNYYLEKIAEGFEQNEVRFLVLKGGVLKKIYPETYMRKSSDLDVFVYDNLEKAMSVMDSLGFKKSDEDYGVHYNYALGSVEVELHYSMMRDKYPWSQECNAILERTHTVDGWSYQQEMSYEDYYFYMIAHMAKHMKNGGAGIRFILDIWVYLSVYENIIDWNILNETLKRAGLYDFNVQAMKLRDVWYKGETLGEELTAQLEEFVFANGWIGTVNSHQRATMSARDAVSVRKNKLDNLKQVVFPSLSIMKSRYSVLAKHPYLMPLFWVVRWVDTVLNKREMIKLHRNVMSVDVKEAVSTSEFFDNLGL